MKYYLPYSIEAVLTLSIKLSASSEKFKIKLKYLHIRIIKYYIRIFLVTNITEN